MGTISALVSAHDLAAENEIEAPPTSSDQAQASLGSSSSKSTSSCSSSSCSSPGIGSPITSISEESSLSIDDIFGQEIPSPLPESHLWTFKL